MYCKNAKLFYKKLYTRTKKNVLLSYQSNTHTHTHTLAERMQTMAYYTVKELKRMVTKLVNDINGNPRYHLPRHAFVNSKGEFIRPKYVSKYRGKKLATGWTFQSYNLEYDLECIVESIADE